MRPPAEPPPTDPRLRRDEARPVEVFPARPLRLSEEVVGVAAGVWMLTGLFLDGLAHVELRPDSFFTPWHLVLYSGFAAASASAVVPVLRRRSSSQSWRAAMPEGHGWTSVGIAIFGVGAVFDFAWHEIVGFEVSNEALLSPSHLTLVVGGVLGLSGPLRTGWRRLESTSPLSSWLPMVGSLALITGIGIFFTSYLTPFGRQSAASFPSTTTHTHEIARFDLVSFEQLREVWGIAGILVATLLMVIPLMLLIRKARPAFGACTLLFAALGLLFPALGEFRQWPVVITTTVAGLLTDLAIHRLPTPIFAAGIAPLVAWCGYFAALALRGRLVWSLSLWSGSVVLATLTGLVIGLLSQTWRNLEAAPHGADGAT